MKNTGQLVSILAVTIFSLIFCSCGGDNRAKRKFIEKSTIFASGQTIHMLEKLGKPTGENYPLTVAHDGEIETGVNCNSGFFPGSLWYIYELTGAKEWKHVAENWTTAIDPIDYFDERNNSCLAVNCSYGIALRLDPKPEYSEIILKTADIIAGRYKNAIKLTDSKNDVDGCLEQTHYMYLSVNSLDDLGLLFTAHKISHDRRYYDIALSYANAVLRGLFNEMPDSRHHAANTPDIDYSGEAKLAREYCTVYGEARDQALALYSFMMTYRESGEQRYLEAAIKVADTYIANLPNDLIPYYDSSFMDDIYPLSTESQTLNEYGKYRDTAAAAIACSALFDLSILSKENEYVNTAINMFRSLNSPDYRAKRDTNGGFLLMHSIDFLKGYLTVNVPTVYADYYFLEALVKYTNLP